MANVEKFKSDFDKAAPILEKVAAEIGASPKIIKAQAALESGWGDRALGNNYFGIKATSDWKGKTQDVHTHEVVNGKRLPIIDKFRVYNSMEESISDYGKFIQENPRYKDAIKAGKEQGEEAYVKGMAKAGYATDPDYAAKIFQTANGPTLNDGQKITSPVKEAPAPIVPVQQVASLVPVPQIQPVAPKQVPVNTKNVEQPKVVETPTKDVEIPKQLVSPKQIQNIWKEFDEAKASIPQFNFAAPQSQKQMLEALQSLGQESAPEGPNLNLQTLQGNAEAKALQQHAANLRAQEIQSNPFLPGFQDSVNSIAQLQTALQSYE